MSLAELQKAIELIERNSEQSDFDGEKSEKLIALAESALGLRFPPTYKRFLSKYGCGDIAGQEFYGIINADFSNSSVPDAIWLTLNERKNSGLPESLVIVYSTGDGVYYALDCSSRNVEGECPVVAWPPGVFNKADRLEYIAEDFGQFFFVSISRALS